MLTRLSKISTFFCACVLTLSACNQSSNTGEKTPQQPISKTNSKLLNGDISLEDLISQMTLAEKIGQMTLIEKDSVSQKDIRKYCLGGILSGGGGAPRENTAENWATMVDNFQQVALESCQGIPLIYGVDAVHGHNNLYGAVIFPHNIGLGAAGDPELMTRIGQVTAKEMVATGIYWNYAPMVAVGQDLRWGRTYETYSEDSSLVSTLATAYIKGLQGADLSDETTVLATPKHFIGDGATVFGTSTYSESLGGGKQIKYLLDQGDAKLDEETLRSVHLPPYEAALDAGALSVMVSFSSWNGVKLHGHRYLLTEVLKGELGFKGFLVSDWQAIDQIHQDYYEAVVTAINAGIDMNMVPFDAKRFINTLTRAVERKDIKMERIDDAVRRILEVKLALGLFQQPFANQSLLSEVGSTAHREVAQEAVSKSMVLLKNENGSLLPLAKDLQRIHVAGQGANDLGIQSGGWTIEWQGKIGDITTGTTILEAIKQTVSSTTVVDYEATGKFESGEVADVCIAVISEQPYGEGRGDRSDLSLSDENRKMLQNLMSATTGNSCKKLVVIMLSGRPLIVTDLIEDWDAFVAAWLPGTEGQGVADVLFGDRPFTGKLSFTWPRSMDQVPRSAVTETSPLFPYGFGL